MHAIHGGLWDDTEERWGTHSDPAALASTRRGRWGVSCRGHPQVPALPLDSTQGYASGAWNKSYSVPATVSKAAATGCSCCLLLEQLLHRVWRCWELSPLLAGQFSGQGKRRFKHYLLLLLLPAGAQCSWCLARWICSDTDPPPPSSTAQKLQSATALKTLSRKERGTEDKERGGSDICVSCSNKGVCHTTPPDKKRKSANETVRRHAMVTRFTTTAH